MNYTQKNEISKLNSSLSSEKSIFLSEKIVENENESINSSPLLSYSVSADRKNITKKILQNIFEIKRFSVNKVKTTKKRQKNYLSNMVLKDKHKFSTIDYNDRVKRDTNEEINYKNSFIEYSYDNIPNCSPIFITATLDGEYHTKTKGKPNAKLFNACNLSYNLKEAIELLHYRGYSKLKSFNRAFLKNKVFKTGKLDKVNRSSISALEPHKDWTAHEHRLCFINNKYLYEYIKTFTQTVKNFGLGRTQILLTEKDLEIIKNNFNLIEKSVIKESKGKKKRFLEYHLENSTVFFQLFDIQDGNELKSVSNYLSSYIDTKHYTFDDDYDAPLGGKNSLEYDAYAYYLASLKDKFNPKKEYGKSHKKVRRINYTQKLISRSVYKRIMTQNFVEYLKEIGEFSNKNMYYNITKMIDSGELKIKKYIEIFGYIDKPNKDTGEIKKIPKFDRNNVNFFNVKYKNHEELVDCKNFDIYKFDYVSGGLILQYEARQIDLKKDPHVIINYKLKRNADKFEHCLKSSHFERYIEDNPITHF